MFITSGLLTLGGAPRVAVSVSDGVARDAVDAAMTSGAGFFELRADRFSERSPEAVLAEMRRYSGIPTLLTIRSNAEGGAWDSDETTRAHLFDRTIPHADAVDIEIGATAIRDNVIARAREHGKIVIGSFHDFAATPPLAALRDVAAAGRAAGVDIVKVAATCHTLDDVRSLARFTLDEAERGVIAVGMGEHGLCTRIFFGALGSLVTYSFLGAPTAPGQLNCEETLGYLKTFRLSG